MHPAEYAKYDGLGLAELVRRGEIAPSQLMEAALRAVELVNPHINAVIEVYPDALEIAGGDDGADGPFRGVPFLRKDLGATEAGRLQELGSRLFQGHVPREDAYLVQRFKAAGLKIFGRSAVPELGISGQTESILTGITRSPWDLERMAGGSSGGAAAAVAAGIVPVAHASDGGGSTRIPASCCGLVGLNPSRGRISGGPNRQDPMFGLSREFVVSRTVRDTAAMLDAVHGAGIGDPFIIAPPTRPYREELRAPPEKLRLAYTTSAWADAPLDDEVVRAVEKTAALCEEMGHTVSCAQPELDFEEVNTAVKNAFGLADAGLANAAAALGRRISAEFLEPCTLKMVERARSLPLADVLASFEVMRRAWLVVGRFFAEYDALLTPSLSRLPQPHGIYTTKREDIDPDTFWRLDHSLFQHLAPFNVTGTPSISLPLFQSDAGLPIGIQFAAAFGREDRLIRIARVFEDALPWSGRTPPVHASTAS